MNEQELRDLVRRVAQRVLDEQGNPPPGTSPGRVRLLVAARSAECLEGRPHALLERLRAEGWAVEVQLPPLNAGAAVNTHIVLLPALRDDDLGLLALGIFREPLGRLVLRAVAAGKPVVAVAGTSWDDALRTHQPKLLALWEEYRAALPRCGIVLTGCEQVHRVLNELAVQDSGSQTNTSPATAVAVPPQRGKTLVSAADVARVGRGGSLRLPPGALVTPLARDRARELDVKLLEG